MDCQHFYSRVVTDRNRPPKGRLLKTVSLFALFGQYTGYGAAVLAFFVTIVLVIGFRQGREISFWPPRVGPQPQTQAVGKACLPREARRNSSKHTSGGKSETDNLSTTFEPRDASKFYQMIASKYDERNSANLIATHMDTIERIEQARVNNPGIRILDLGGGTGQNIATHFFNDKHIHWDYVDSCSEMVSLFRQNLAGRPLGKDSQVHLA